MYQSLSKADTNVLKGIALLLLLFHHLFWKNNGLYVDITFADHNLVQAIGEWSKLCVAIFVFLSGYGLTVQAQKSSNPIKLKQFYWHRFSKLLLNYWFIWLVFVPIGIYVFDYSFSDAYGNHLFIKFLLDFFGIISAFGIYGYNATCWFYSCIILLYLLFPFLYRAYKVNSFLAVLIVLVGTFLPIPLFIIARNYLPSFLLGIVYCCCSSRYVVIGGINAIAL